MNNLFLKSTQINTLLGSMLAIADENALYLLEFLDRRGLDKEVKKLATYATIESGVTSIHELIQIELSAYFAGKSRLAKQFPTLHWLVTSRCQLRFAR